MIRARWMPTTRDSGGVTRFGYMKSLGEPEHCGEPGMPYRVRKKAQAQRNAKGQKE
jgi:hypothetical protein